MVTKTGATGLRNRLAGVQSSQEVHNLKEEITTLQAELSELRSGNLSSDDQTRLNEEVQRLTAELGNRSGKHKIRLDAIDLDVNQPRETITESMVVERANSLRRHGQLTPIILIPQLTGRYLLFEGELRTRAARSLSWTELEAVFLSPEDLPSPEEAFRGQVVTSIHAQRLHDLDIAKALIRLAISDYPNMQGQDSIIPNFLNTPIRRMQRDNTLSQLADIRIADAEAQKIWLSNIDFKADEERQIFELILGLQLNPVTVNTNIFPLLKLAADLKETIQTLGLESSKARELNRLSPSNLKLEEVETTEIRKILTQQTIELKLSLMEVKAKVNELIQQHNPKKKKDKSGAVAQVVEVFKEVDLASDSIEELKTLLALLHTKTKEVKELISGEEF
jgi:ParB family transcriptional regulator, chromosome partitioning protein